MGGTTIKRAASVALVESDRFVAPADLPPVPPDAPTTGDPQAWAAFAGQRFLRTSQSIIEFGEALLLARVHITKHGEWERMFRDSKKHVKDPLPFDHTTGMRLRKIGEVFGPVLRQGAHAQLLPGSWMTLYELTKLPPKILDRRFNEGKITPLLERKDVAGLYPSKKRPPKRGKPAKKPAVDNSTVGLVDFIHEAVHHLLGFWRAFEERGYNADPLRKYLSTMLKPGHKVTEQAWRRCKKAMMAQINATGSSDKQPDANKK